jgi:hypothetical protein
MRRHHRHTSPHALGNGMSDRLETCLAGLVESLRGWSVGPGTGPITTLESSTFNARRTRIVRRGFGVGRSPLDVKLRSRHSNRLIVSERWQPSRNFFKSQKYNTLLNRDFS